MACNSSPTQPQSQRIMRPKPKLSFLSVFTLVGAQWNFATLIPHSDNEHLSFVAQIADDFEQINGLFNDMINEICHHIQVYTTSNESFTYSQMLCENDCIKFFEAMEVEICDHKDHGHWTLMLSKDLPVNLKTIMAVWSFKHKIFPDGMLNKHKAQLFAHGGHQTWGLDYWDTYAPVVTWASVQLLLIITKIHGLKFKSIDFVLAFPQANLDVPVYMKLPAGINPTNLLDGGSAMSSNSTKVSIVSNRLAITGSKSYTKGSLLAISFKVRLINASSFKRVALFSLMLTIALCLARIWQSLMQLFPPCKAAMKTLTWSTRAVSTNIYWSSNSRH